MPQHPHPDAEVLDSFMRAHTLALRALVRCLEANGALKPNQFAESLRLSMGNGVGDEGALTLAMMQAMRRAVVE